MVEGGPADVDDVLEQAFDCALPSYDDLETRHTFTLLRNELFDADEPIQIGPYRVRGQVGAGGLGIVLRAHDPRLDREVAVKLLRHETDPWGSTDRARCRMLEEARNLARVADPNVVEIYDANLFEGRVYLVMELVQGRNLARWLEDEEQTLDAVLDTFVGAGRGLSAIHAAGLVHCDFKPLNVLVGDDGRVRVVDFGLTTVLAAGACSSTAERPQASVRATRAAGTPAFMAPEQHEGRIADARTDVYAFCASLWNAAYGRPPFAGDSGMTLYAGKLAERFDLSRARRRLPWLTRILMKGMAANPHRRWQSIDEVLGAIETGRTRRRRLGWTVPAGLTSLALVGMLAQPRPDDCDPRSELEGVWDAQIEAEASRAFAASGHAYTEHAWAPTHRALRHYAQRWQSMRTEACRQRDDDAPVLVDARRACLDDARARLDAVVGVLAAGSPQTVLHAHEVVSTLPDLSRCDPATLARAVPAELTPESAEARRAIAEADALTRAQQLDLAVAKAQGALARAERAGNVRQLIDARLSLATAQAGRGRVQRADRLLLDALELARDAGDPNAELRTLIELIHLDGTLRMRPEHARRWGSQAQTVLDTHQSLASFRAGQLEVRLGAAEMAARQYARARQHYDEARRWIGAGSPLGLRTALADGDALAAEGQGHYAEALVAIDHVLDLRRTELGPSHPDTGTTMVNRGMLLVRLDRNDEALEELAGGLHVLEAVHGPEHPLLLQSLLSLGAVLARVDRAEEAIETYQRAIDIATRVYGPAHTLGLAARNNAAMAMIRLGRADEAEHLAREALSAFDANEQELTLSNVRATLAEALQAQGRFGEARRELDHAIASRIALLGAEHPEVEVLAAQRQRLELQARAG